MIDQLEIHCRLYLVDESSSNYQQMCFFFFFFFEGIPDAPTNVRLMVTGSNSITVTYDEPHRSNGAMVIKYKSMTILLKNFVRFFLKEIVNFCS